MKNTDFTTQKRCLKTTALAAILAVASAGLVTASAIAAVTGVSGFNQRANVQVIAALKLRLPKTPITSLGCEGFGGLCEVVSDKALFYIDERARYLFVGRLYDMETRADLTAAKLLAIIREPTSWYAKTTVKRSAAKGQSQRSAKKWSYILGQSRWSQGCRLLRFPMQLLQAAHRRTEKGARPGRRTTDFNLRRTEPGHFQKRDLCRRQGGSPPPRLCRRANGWTQLLRYQRS